MLKYPSLMARNRYYYYDHESCAFVEARPRRRRFVMHATLVGFVSLLLSAGFTWSLDRMTQTPQEIALEAERSALQEQLALARLKMERFSEELAELSETDEEVYRTLLEAEPISEQTRRVGVGGADPYVRFDGYSPQTANLLRQSSQIMDQLERQISLQNASYRELATLAEERSEMLAQLPALMPTTGRIVSGYGMRHHPVLRVRKMHAGIDILVRQGTPIYAAGDGVVKTATYSPTYGYYVEIEHPEAGYTSLYAHLSEFAAGVKVGKKVARGEQIALSGNTGRSTGPHLHYEVRGKDGQALDPVEFVAPTLTPQQYRALRTEADAAHAPLSLH